MPEHRKIKFYSTNGMSSGYQLTEAETIFQNWEYYIDTKDINVLLELFNIKRFIDSDIRLKKWSDAQFKEYRDKCVKLPALFGKFFCNITDANLEYTLNTTEQNYRDDFWYLFCYTKTYTRISENTIRNMLENNNHIVWDFIKHKELVNSFGQVIAEYLTINAHTARHLISYYLVAHDQNAPPMYFPKEFTQTMRDEVLADYVERDDINTNYLKILEQAQSTKEFPISDKLRLKARKKKEELYKKLLPIGSGFEYGAEVSFKSLPDYSCEIKDDNGIKKCSYSREWIADNLDFPTLLNNFIYLFNYVDRFFRCTFVSLQSELELMERFLGVKAKREYLHGIEFNSKRILSLVQMTAYNEELKRNNIRIEDIFKWFFEVYLKDEFGANGFTYTPSSDGTTYFEKCKLLSSAIDGVLKQYSIYCDEGIVNRELLEMSSSHIVFSDIKGIVSNKYVYAVSDEIQKEMFLMFSDQSMLSYTEKTKSRYTYLIELLISEQIKKDDFDNFQQPYIEWLINRSDVFINADGFLSVNNDRVFVIKDLYQKEVTCPHYLDNKLKDEIDHLVSTGDLQYDNSLLSKPEQDYLNYILNKSVFCNGLDLRNRYIHDTCSLDEKTQHQDYCELLKIMILLIIKINEEFTINNS